MKVLLIKNNRLYHYNLPKKIKDNFWITDIDSYDNLRNLINVEENDNRWMIVSNYDTHIMNGNNIVERVYLEEKHFYIIKNDNEKSNYYLYCESDIERDYQAFSIVSNGSFLIGTNNTNNIIYNNGLVSDVHAKLEFNDGLWQIIDNNSFFGVYVNDKKIDQNMVLKYGDIIFIAGLKIIVMKDFLMINSNNLIQLNTNLLTIKPNMNFNIDKTILKDEELNRNLYSKEEYFYRSPRFIEDIVKEEITIDNPPIKVEQDETSLIMVIGPMFTMALTSLTTSFTTINNITNGTTTWEKSIPSLVLAGSMFLSMLVWPLVARFLDRKKRKKKENERITKYSAYLDSKSKEIDSVISNQSTILKEKYIPLTECANIIMRKKSNLWERSISQKDFLTLRLGIGNMPVELEVKYSKEGFTMEEDELKKKIEEIVSSKKQLVDVPITFSLIEKNITSIIGDKHLLHEFFKGQLLQLMTFQSYEFLKMVILTDNENQSAFSYLHNLPYLFDNTKQIRFFATNLDETKELSLYLERIYQDRKSNDKIKFTETPPYYLIITDNYHMYRDIEIIKDILKDDDNYGFSLMIFSEKLANLPSECKNFINVNPSHSGIFESEISMGNQREFQTELCNDINIDECIKKICNIPIEFKDDDKALPSTISFLEMYNVGRVEQLNVQGRYQNNNSQKSLAVPVGIEKSGSFLKLDLHEKYHGPHGLIAGMTGSGKSEFIITYILSMAVNFSPEDVAFILIDYKGGGLAGAFENRETGVSLPHLAGTITNLDVSEMNRSLSSIQSELRRRQQIFNEARDKLGESTVDIYKYQRFYKEGKVSEAIPHLFIISDEFAELKSQQPDFMDGLIQAARIGRSLGVHLILATQKPSGVVNDQIWSNSRFRVCLKVQEKSDSNEMIKAPDAAFLKQAGRFYLQVGYNELFALGQSAWCGAQYFPTEKIKKKIDQSVLVIDDIGNVIGQYDDMKEDSIKSSGEELSNVLRHVIKVCDDLGKRANKLWLEKILPDIYVDNLVKKYNYHEEKYQLKPIIGEFDDPNNQRQELLYLDLTNDGNTSIYGSAGSGKELFLSSVIYSLITNHSSEEVNMYILDFGSGTLGNFKNAPQIGDIILPTEEEKIQNIFRMIDTELENRKKLFANYNGDFQNYIARSGKTVPYILLFVNNYDVFQDAFDYEEIVNKISRECFKYGIIMIVTVNTANGMRYRLRQNFKSDIALQFNDQDDYSMIIGNTRKLYPSPIFGRGLVKLDNIYEFQTAHIFKDEEYLDKLRDVIDNLNAQYSRRAPKVPVVPETVYIDDVIKYLNGMKNIPVGINKDLIAPEIFNFKDNYVTLVSSNDEEGKIFDFTKALVEIISKVENNNILLLDIDNRVERNYASNVTYVKDSMEEVAKKLCDDMEYVYNEYVQNNMKINMSIRNTVIILVSFSKVLACLSDDLKKRLLDLLEKCKDLHQFDFILVDRVDLLKKMEYESWFKNSINTNFGIWIGNGIADQNLLKTNIGFKKTNNEIPDGYGIVVKNTKTSLVNMITNNVIEVNANNNDDVEEIL